MQKTPAVVGLPFPRKNIFTYQRLRRKDRVNEHSSGFSFKSLALLYLTRLNRKCHKFTFKFFKHLFVGVHG